MSLADRIKEAMGKRMPGEFAKAMKVTPASVTFWLDGRTKSLNSETAAQMELVTGYRANWIVTGLGPKRVGDPEDARAEAWPFTSEMRLRVAEMEQPEIRSLEVAMWVHLDEPVPSRLLREYQARRPEAANEDKERSEIEATLAAHRHKTPKRGASSRKERK